MSDSTVYSMGTALSRAHDNGTDVEVLVGGQWLAGMVVAYDGHGVVLEGADRTHAVIRMESIQAVRVDGLAPARPQLPSSSGNVFSMAGNYAANR